MVFAGEKCQAVLAQFSDSDRQPLTTRLTALNVSVQAYLRLFDRPGRPQHPRCEQPGILAFTTPGSRAIYVCGEAFVRLSLRTPEEARTTVIHEVLPLAGTRREPAGAERHLAPREAVVLVREDTRPERRTASLPEQVRPAEHEVDARSLGSRDRLEHQEPRAIWRRRVLLQHATRTEPRCEEHLVTPGLGTGPGAIDTACSEPSWARK